MRLQDKVAIVTGAASGIGYAMTTRFIQEGAKVVAADWHEARLKEAVASWEASGAQVRGVQGNVADEATAAGLIDTAVDTFGRLDVLVNNAGIMDYMAGIGEVTDEVLERVMGVNLFGPMYTARRAVQQMLEQGSGSIINVASTAGISGGAAGAAYTVSKHGVVGLTRNTAWMYAQRGIRCNAICPGATRTHIAETMPQDKLDPAGAGRAMAFAGLVPAQLEPQDIAELALFLAADESHLINGAIIPADGGWKAV